MICKKFSSGTKSRRGSEEERGRFGRFVQQRGDHGVAVQRHRGKRIRPANASELFVALFVDARVFPLLLKSKDARKVNHASVAANTNGEFDLKSLEKHPECSEHYSTPWQMYGQTKLANIVFTKALDSRLRKKRLQT